MIDVFRLPRGAQEFWIAYCFEGLDAEAIESAKTELAAELGCQPDDVVTHAGRELLRRVRQRQAKEVT